MLAHVALAIDVDALLLEVGFDHLLALDLLLADHDLLLGNRALLDHRFLLGQRDADFTRGDPRGRRRVRRNRAALDIDLLVHDRHFPGYVLGFHRLAHIDLTGLAYALADAQFFLRYGQALHRAVAAAIAVELARVRIAGDRSRNRR